MYVQGRLKQSCSCLLKVLQSMQVKLKSQLLNLNFRGIVLADSLGLGHGNLTAMFTGTAWLAKVHGSSFMPLCSPLDVDFVILWVFL